MNILSKRENGVEDIDKQEEDTSPRDSGTGKEDWESRSVHGKNTKVCSCKQKENAKFVNGH
jgi:hypothetical protein